MSLKIATEAEWLERCRNDGEFMLAARHWTGELQLAIGDSELCLRLKDGTPHTASPSSGGVIRLTGAPTVWEAVLASLPSRFNNDLISNMTHRQGISRKCDPVTFAQYYPAIARAVELLRSPADDGKAQAHEFQDDGSIGAPVGRYIYVTLGGQKHRIYYEEAGQGIPMLLHHTAGCHGSQWRHLLENTDLTSRFRLIAFDLPYHGKSLPPVEEAWWDHQYLLRGELLRSLPVELSRLLGLDRPIFMGCSVGGLLALDLAHKHPDEFRAVISLEGALEIPGSMDVLDELWHPKISNEYKARVMEGLMSPASPKRYRKETSFVYASGWPQMFLGDLYYYMEEFDLRESAHEIDTSKVGVHILSGEYDASSPCELGEEAHKAIAGSTYTEMKNLGHFPMSENPDAFLEYLTPVLDRIS
ncbi:MAG: alpha/beta hydrolase [Pseudomonadaceae bacterium]|nr:alpha/beta hydrolase [Pseudomonadaceae bacterium]